MRLSVKDLLQTIFPSLPLLPISCSLFAGSSLWTSYFFSHQVPVICQQSGMNLLFTAFYCIVLWNCTQIFFWGGYKRAKCNHSVPSNSFSINIWILTKKRFSGTLNCRSKIHQFLNSDAEVREDL